MASHSALRIQLHATAQGRTAAEEGTDSTAAGERRRLNFTPLRGFLRLSAETSAQTSDANNSNNNHTGRLQCWSRFMLVHCLHSLVVAMKRRLQHFPLINRGG